VELGVDALIFYLEKGLFPELEATTERLLALSDLPLAKVAKIKDFQKQLPQIRERIADSARELAAYAAEAPLDMAALSPRTQVLSAHACSCTPALTRLLLHACSYTLTRLLLHACSCTPALARLLLHA
jgi:hypothetical protein